MTGNSITVRSNTPFAGLYLVYKGSVANENESNYGISHLMEHLLFKNYNHLLSDFSQDGIISNAYTSDSEIVFYFQGLEEYLFQYENRILNLLNSFNTTQQQLENEKQIVLQEYLNGFSVQAEAHFANLFRTEFNYYGPIGKKECFMDIKLDDCYNYYDLQFKQPDMIIYVSPNLPTNIPELKLDSKELYLKREIGEPEIISSFEETRSVIFWKLIDSDNFKQIKLLSEIMGSGLESPIYQTLREEHGLVYAVHTFTQRLNKDQSLICIMAEMHESNVSEFCLKLNETLKNAFSEKRFNVIKNSEKVRLKKAEILNYLDVQKFISPEETILLEDLDKFSYDDLMNIYEFDFKDFEVSIDGEINEN